MVRNQILVDRRKHVRAALAVDAVVFSADRLEGSFPVQDLSSGGALLQGDVPVRPGSSLSIQLRFPGKAALRVGARILRRDKAGAVAPLTAVTFVDLLPEEEDAIHEVIVSALERDNARQSATILVVDDDNAARDGLEQDLRALGHEAVCVATPLDALGWLARPNTKIATVLVDVTPGPLLGLDVLDFVTENHPQIQRVVMASETRPFRLDLALRSGRAHKVLSKPWNRNQLAEAFGQRARADGGAEPTDQ